MVRALALGTACLALCACPKKDEPAPTPPKPPAAKPQLPAAATEAEVEFTGKWSLGPVKAAAVVFVAQLEPCLPVPEKPTRLGEERLNAPGDLFAEFFIKQGTVGHACVYAKDDAGQLVGAGAFPGNPLTFAGDGEVVFKGTVELAPLPAK